ncbi:hypothetical protein [Streptomyces fuscus]|uniref:hypothetical protein n=1 Tax=Streptomyces fuscus TaxID=3048495 RepID=UPI0025573F92|nr:hypothetical protein [Streptomyces fuscus]
MYVDVALYNNDAEHLVAEALTRVAINEESIQRAYNELKAELEMPFGGEGYDAVRDALLKLNEQPWQSVEQLGVIDTKRTRKKAGELYVAEGKPVHSHKLKLSVQLDQQIAVKDRHLLPLFHELAWLLLDNVSRAVSWKYGYFYASDKTAYTSKLAAHTAVFSVGEAPVDLEDVITLCREVVGGMHEDGAFERFVKQLKHVSYSDERNSLRFDAEKNYELTSVFVGEKGWRQLATQRNLEGLLSSIQVQVQFGCQKIVR